MQQFTSILFSNNNGPEIGAAWKHIGEKTVDYVSLLLDDPAMTQRILANLFQSNDDKCSWSTGSGSRSQ